MIKPLDSYHHVSHAPLPHVLDSTNIREIQVLCWVGHKHRAITNLSKKYNDLSMFVILLILIGWEHNALILIGQGTSLHEFYEPMWESSSTKRETKANTVIEKALQLWKRKIKKTGKVKITHRDRFVSSYDGLVETFLSLPFPFILETSPRPLPQRSWNDKPER